jgi:hypothetical protein
LNATFELGQCKQQLEFVFRCVCHLHELAFACQNEFPNLHAWNVLSELILVRTWQAKSVNEQKQNNSLES